jgi:hypothetical protein
MEWGSHITVLGTTILKDRTVNFGIKDSDRLKHVAILGQNNTVREKCMARMIFQDIERGLGTVVLDAHGTLAPYILERLGRDATDRLIYLDPADAEYPYSWNLLSDARALPAVTREKKMKDLLRYVYDPVPEELVELVTPLLLKNKNATLVSFYELITDREKRHSFFADDEPGRESFENNIQKYANAIRDFESVAQYITKDALIRNVLGQHESKFSFQDVTKDKIIIVNLEKVRMFPTRMVPLVRTFVEGTRMAGEVSTRPLALYLHDTLRYVSAAEAKDMLTGSRVACTIADASAHEENKKLREEALSRCGSIITFALNPFDKSIIENTFYPYIHADELEAIGDYEFVVALTVDNVRTQPFFGTLASEERRRVQSYQDLVAQSRKTFTTARTTVDELFQEEDDEDERPKRPGNFQDAFKAMFEKRAQRDKRPADKPVGEEGSEKKPPVTNNAQQKDTPSRTPPANAVREIPEHTLKDMLYVSMV